MYRDRLLKLPRRLGFEATPQSLEQSCEAVKTDLLEYSRTASAWTRAGSDHAATLLAHLRETEDTLVASTDLQNAFLDDLAQHISTSAEVDDEAQLRSAFKRYAAGLSAYARRSKAEKMVAIEDLRRRRQEIEAWLSAAATSTFLDPETGLLNRAAAEMRIDTEIGKGQSFSIVVAGRTDVGSPALEGATGPIMKELGDRLAATIRPYDMIFRWSEHQLVTIFEAASADIAVRVQQIGGWLADGQSTVEIAGVPTVVKTRTTVSVVEHASEESAAHLIARVESESRQEVGAR